MKLTSSALGIALITTVANASPALHSNGQPYKVTTPAAATGRAGNAKLAARALMNKDGTTDFDVTTGTLDSSATAPGNISKIQFKAYNGNGDVQWTKNYNSLASGGSLHYSFADLHRGQPIQTQANIDKIDKRTDVVTVTGNVKLRPDLSVVGVTAPDRAVVGSHVDISAKVRELDGDVGATGDCKLFVDDAQVDQALGIWVDAGGLVTCAFNYQFNATGTHTLKIAVDNVVPGDYDASNNSASSTIDIVDNGPTVYYWANAWSYSGTFDDHWEGHYYDPYYGYTHDWSYENAGSQSWQGEQMWGYSPTVAQFPLQSVALKLTNLDDNSTSDTSFAYVNSYSWGDSSYGGSCDQRWGADWWNTQATLCTQTWNGSGGTWLSEQRFAGDVTYHSQGYDQWWDYWYGSYGYTWNYDTSYTYGQPYTVGSQFQIAASWVDAAGASFAPVATIATQPQSFGCQQALTCWTYNWGWGNEEYCSSCNDSFSGVSGSSSGSTSSAN